MTPPETTSARVGLATVLLAACLAAGSQAQSPSIPPDTVLRDFQPVWDYLLTIDGRHDPAAQIYQSQRAAAFLVIAAPTLPSPVLLSPRTMTAATVSVTKISKKPDGTIDLLSDASLSPQGQILIKDEDVLFTADGHKASLSPKPPLLGLRRASDVTSNNPEYAISARKYYPNGEIIAGLKKEKRPVMVRIYFGSWCPHCRMMVPHALKVEEQLKGTNIHFEYFGLPTGFGSDPEAMKMAIREVPTGIVLVNGRELGRISRSDWDSPEKALTGILAGKAQASGR